MSKLPSNFMSLSALEKRAAVERATGLTWDQWSAIDPQERQAMLLSLQGYTYQGGVDEMLGAARKDSFWSGVGGYFSGMGAGLKIALVLGVVAVVWVALPRLGKVRRAVWRAA